MSLFRDEKAYPVETYDTPIHVETAVNAIWKNSTLMTPIGGGVRIEASKALASNKLLSDSGRAVQKARQAVDPAKVDHNRWWWD